VNHFDPKKDSDAGAFHTAQLRHWLLALSHVVSRLERTHSALVEAIVEIPWTTMDSTIVKSYVHFIGTLLSARPEYLSLILGKITHGFTYRSSQPLLVSFFYLTRSSLAEYGHQALHAGMPEGSSSPLTRRTIYDRLHTLLRHIYSLIPTLPSTLRPLLVRDFPHKRQDQVAQTTYVRNLLRVTEYCPELFDKILALIIDHTIQIDVRTDFYIHSIN
jgi:RNA polymerase I-specific transcription initiation factor RRN3